MINIPYSVPYRAVLGTVLGALSIQAFLSVCILFYGYDYTSAEISFSLMAAALLVNVAVVGGLAVIFHTHVGFRVGLMLTSVFSSFLILFVYVISAVFQSNNQIVRNLYGNYEGWQWEVVEFYSMFTFYGAFALPLLVFVLWITYSASVKGKLPLNSQTNAARFLGSPPQPPSPPNG